MPKRTPKENWLRLFSKVRLQLQQVSTRLSPLLGLLFAVSQLQPATYKLWLTSFSLLGPPVCLRGSFALSVVNQLEFFHVFMFLLFICFLCFVICPQLPFLLFL